MKKYILISGFNTNDNNRGTAALSYGSINFCIQKGYLKEGQELVNFRYVKKFWKKEYEDFTETYEAEGKTWKRNVLHIFFLEKWLYDFFHLLLPFTKFGRAIRKTELVASINGGDGFADIYGTQTFFGRLSDTDIAMRENIPLVILPQTIGPFKDAENLCIADRILKYAKEVFVRDDKFVKELKRMGVKYMLTKDLSYFMAPEPWDIEIKSKSIGLNVSGLAYSNKFKGLEGQFDAYPALIEHIISHFRNKGCTIYLIPHSYGYTTPIADDDMIACRKAYERLADKSNVVLVDKDLISPQVKYVISRMTFFIGARMHANFAAIYTGVPVFGTAYSYKFEGAFNANGLDGKKQTRMINHLKTDEINDYIQQIDAYYKESVNK